MRFSSSIIFATAIFALSAAEFLTDLPVPSTVQRRPNDPKKDDEGRLPREYLDDEANIQRLHIEHQTGFDGKVRNIEIEPNQRRAGVRAYGLQKKKLENNGLIEKIQMEESRTGEELLRNARVVEAYGMAKKQLENNGKIERMPPIAIVKTEEWKNDALRRNERSIPKEEKNEANDLEAQDAKVFRPLFVYRQQMAKRQKLNKRRDLVYDQPHYYRRVYGPWVQRYPVH